MKRILTIFSIILLFIEVGKVYSQPNPGYPNYERVQEMDLIIGGGGFGSSARYQVFSVLGLPTAPKLSKSGGYTHYQGFFSTAPVLPPIHPRIGSKGTEITIRGSAFGLKKGKVFLGRMVEGTFKKMALKILSWRDDVIRVRLHKFPSWGPGVYDIIVRRKGAYDDVNELSFTVRALFEIYMSEGEGYPNAESTIKGMFFGTKKGKVYLERGPSEEPIPCKVLSWYMNPTTGESEVTFNMPKTIPAEYDIVPYPYGVSPKYFECFEYCSCPSECPSQCYCPPHCDREKFCKCIPNCDHE